jgi:hypothetical protein
MDNLGEYLMQLLFLKRWTPVWWPLALLVSIIVSRICTFLIFENFNILNDSGVPIKFAGHPAFLDYGIYKNHITSAWSEISRPIQFLLMLLEDWQGAITWLQEQPLKPGPLYPMLLSFMGYEDNRNFLAWIYQVAGAFLGWHWAGWLKDKGAHLLLQIIAASFPAVLYFAFLVSTDLLFACLIAIWLSCLRAALDYKMSAWGWTVVLMLALLLTRPNALALIPLMSLLAWKVKSLRAWFIWNFVFGLVGAYMLIYYLPYFWVHESNAGVTSYWGVLPADYYKGLWIEWPTFVSQPLSWALFAISKLMYAVGLRPSYANVDLWLVVLRALPGLLFFPGLIYVVCSGQRFDRWFVILFMLPIFIGASQERYLLALTPILLLWGGRAWSNLASWVRSSQLHSLR